MSTKNSTAEKQEQGGNVIPIVAPTYKHMIVSIVGTSPLLQNPPTREYLEEREAIAMGHAKPKKTPLDPKKEFMSRLRADRKGNYYHPAEAFTGQEGLLVSSLSGIDGRKMKVFKSSVFSGVILRPDAMLSTPEGIRAFIRLIKCSTPVLDRHRASVQSGMVRVPVPIYRPRFDKWQMLLRISYNERLVTESVLMSLLSIGAESGIGAYRRGGFGRFKIEDARRASFSDVSVEPVTGDTTVMAGE